jgi:hypothetical protein
VFLLNTEYFLFQILDPVRGQLPIILKMLQSESFHLPLVLLLHPLCSDLAFHFSLGKPSFQRLLRRSGLFLKPSASLLLLLQSCQFCILLSLLLGSLTVLFSPLLFLLSPLVGLQSFLLRSLTSLFSPLLSL